MKHAARWSLCLSLVVLLSACGDRTATSPETAQTASDAPQAAAEPTAASGSTDSGDAIELTVENLNRYVAAHKAMADASGSDPAMDELIAINASVEDAEQYAARLQSNAKARDLIASAGMSTREFALTGDLLVTALMAQAALDAGQIKTLPEGIDPASVEFVKQHHDKIQQLIGSDEAEG